MASIYLKKKINSTLERAWSKIGKPDEIHLLLSILESAHVLNGVYRTCQLKKGLPVSGEIKELIFSVDEQQHRVAYTIIASPFGFEQHAASMQLSSEADGVYFTWITDVKPDSLTDSMKPLFEQEFKHIVNVLDSERILGGI